MRDPGININEVYRRAERRWPVGAPLGVFLAVLLVGVEVYNFGFHQPPWNYLPLTDKPSTVTWALLGGFVWLVLHERHRATIGRAEATQDLAFLREVEEVLSARIAQSQDARAVI